MYFYETIESNLVIHERLSITDYLYSKLFYAYTTLFFKSKQMHELFVKLVNCIQVIT
jgi:hypothetical protein